MWLPLLHATQHVTAIRFLPRAATFGSEVGPVSASSVRKRGSARLELTTICLRLCCFALLVLKGMGHWKCLFVPGKLQKSAIQSRACLPCQAIRPKPRFMTLKLSWTLSFYFKICLLAPWNLLFGEFLFETQGICSESSLGFLREVEGELPSEQIEVDEWIPQKESLPTPSCERRVGQPEGCRQHALAGRRSGGSSRFLLGCLAFLNNMRPS